MASLSMHLDGAATASTVRRYGCLPAVLPCLMVALSLASLLPGTVLAHEAWLLTPDQIARLNTQPRPELFTRVSATNAAMLAAAVAGIVGWLALAARAVSHRVANAQAWLTRHDRYAPVIVRLCLGLTLATAALALHPRHGTDPFQAATLGFPDLELRLLGAGWGWLAGLELALAGALLVGCCPRAAAAGVLLVTVLGLALFGAEMLAYAGAVAGAAGYLILQGGGPLCLPLPSPAGRPAGLGSRQWALLLLRVLTGATFLWCGIRYKVMQPNLVLAIVVHGGVPTFGLGPEAFVFGMALVEVAAGALMMAGVLVRPLALALFGPFLFLSASLGEDPLGHALFYGNLLALATGGAGSWCLARPRSTRISHRAVIFPATVVGNPTGGPRA